MNLYQVRKTLKGKEKTKWRNFKEREGMKEEGRDRPFGIRPKGRLLLINSQFYNLFF